MEREMPKQWDIYVHFKGGFYVITDIAMHTETEETLVIYRKIDCKEKTYARPVEMFLSEVDHEKYPSIKQKYRFEKIENVFGYKNRTVLRAEE